jgi:sugar phosphate isomerase/epimerase
VETEVDGSVRWEHAWAGLPTGQADVAAYLRHLTELGYHGWVTVEHFSTEPAAGRAHGPEPRLLPGGRAAAPA